MHTARPFLTCRRFWLIIFLLAALFFTCRGIAASSFVMSSAAGHHETCCTEEGTSALSIMHMQLQSAAFSPFGFAVLAVVVAAFFLPRTSLPAHKTTVSYARAVRAKWGSWRIFMHVIHLFRRGILHPKTY